MQTHSIQFGKHGGHAHSHGSSSAHTKQLHGHFVSSHPKSSGNKKHDALVKQTQKWVSQTFYGEMLKQMRNSPFKSKMFDGGQGGQAFTQMFDQHLADRMATGTGKKLIDSIVNKIEAGKAYKADSAKPAGKIKVAPVSPALRSTMGGLA